MRKLCLGMLTGGVTLGSPCDAAPAQAIVFNVRFDGVANGLPLELPIVGNGTLSFDGNGSVGEVPLTSLPNYSFWINLGGATYTNANITTPVANVITKIVSSGSDWSLTFTGTGGGPSGGSLDFEAEDGKRMTFQPNGGHLYAYNLNSDGTFEALAHPIPAPGPLPLLGLSAAFGFSRRLRKRTMFSNSAASVQKRWSFRSPDPGSPGSRSQGQNHQRSRIRLNRSVRRWSCCDAGLLCWLALSISLGGDPPARATPGGPQMEGLKIPSNQSLRQAIADRL